MEHIDWSLIDWSRAQFALTAMYHWLFVPLTLGITFILAIMETIYVKTGNEEWKKMTKFWMTLFGINFAIGVATGIILEFEFGLNWSAYSWFVGDIFGAPLAIEGILAFFMESTFIAVMFFGWNKVSKRFHLTATWLTAIGANLSALWILVANGWMQNPVGMNFNPLTARNEMDAKSFLDILFSDTAVSKWLHTTSSGFVLASVVVIGISAWYILKGRHLVLARKSIIVASIFGLLSSLFVIYTGDLSAKAVGAHQPMKLAAMEGLYEGKAQADLSMFGLMSCNKDETNLSQEGKFLFNLHVPISGTLSFLTTGNFNTFVPGIKDIVEGNAASPLSAVSYDERIVRGYKAQQDLVRLHELKADPAQEELFKASLSQLQSPEYQQSYFKYFGYGTYYNADPTVRKANALKLIPNVPLTFYSFRIMIILGTFFVLLFIYFFILAYKDKLNGKNALMRIAIFSIPLVYLCSQAGWIVAEVGRQPWVIQDMMTTATAVTKIASSAVITTFFLFFVVFTALLIAEIRIMLNQIKKGPDKLNIIK